MTYNLYKFYILANTQSSGNFLKMFPWIIAWLILGAILLFITKLNPIGKRELKSFFQSPIAYVCIIIFILVSMSLTFLFGNLLERGEAELASSFFIYHPWVFIIIAPAIGMRLWSEEIRLGTIELLYTYPIKLWQAIIWKFLAGSVVIFTALTFTFPIVITINYLGEPDNGVIFSGYIGSFLLALSCLAVTNIASALSRSQVISLLIGVVACLVFTLSGFPPVEQWFKGLGSIGLLFDWIPQSSFLNHYESFSKGQISLADVAFYLAFIGVSLSITALFLNNKE